MTVNLLVAVLTDLVAIVLLAAVIYYRRHRRSDLLLAYISLNLGVLAVTIALSSVMATTVEAGIGLGLGLFGVLSIIRLRSDQITQAEIAYYFVSLVLGLVAGLNPAAIWVTPVIALILLTAMFVVDHPRVSGATRRQIITMDAAYLDEGELTNALARRLGARVYRVIVHEVDLVRDTTVVDVRYRMAHPVMPARTAPYGQAKQLAESGDTRVQQPHWERVP